MLTHIHRLSAAALVSACLVSPHALAETPQGAADRLDAFLDGIDGPQPGFAIVVADRDTVLLERVSGTTRASGGTPLSADTPLYIASQTKAYLGLLAARLDAEGILPLDSTIADHWPGIDLPGEADAAQWTMRDLLTHQVPISVDLLTELEAYVTRVDPAAYPRLIETYGEAREPGFDYSNLGYNIYAAILETRTGISWQDWLDRAIFEPMGWEASSARTSDFAPEILPWNHVWLGEADGWFELPPKSDAIMQSAGGLMVSPNDMVEWLQLNLRGEGPAGSGLTADMIATAHTSGVATHQEDGRNAYQMPCSGYALGWHVCSFNEETVYVHGGGYTGARSVMAFMPDSGVGLATFSNSDAQTGWFSGRILTQFLLYLTDDETADETAAGLLEAYPDRVGRFAEFRAGRRETAREAEDWQGWTWAPDNLADYAGRWTTGDDWFDLMLSVEGEGLVARWGEARYGLEPAAPDLFGATVTPVDRPDPLSFERDETGAIATLSFQGRTYRRSE